MSFFPPMNDPAASTYSNGFVVGLVTAAGTLVAFKAGYYLFGYLFG